ncbi:V-type ATP synthase subunit E [Clostridium gelidum]|uniref:V-type proton ATPase subunit E n=1 Tax=Clostridium gelidum TaxID=704125 RepID=A0ABM7T688_9CLOT|nr:V-type ATP synthase subunit E family protein [Clostridium gelidum]BCZ47534.1 V-type ATP synthase subunit E [Clostridium gelidum]
MSNINNLTSKIIKDAEDKKEVIIQTAEKEKNRILSKKQVEASTAEKIIIEKAEREAVSRKERIISGAKLQARNEKLEAKQEVIREIFESSIETLCNLSKDDFKEFVKESILNSDIVGEQNIILNDSSKKIINKTFLAVINKELGAKASVILSEETRNFKGGFILEKDGIEINNTFEALVNSLKDDLSIDVAIMLFN